MIDNRKYSRSFNYFVGKHCEHELLTREQEAELSPLALAGDQAAIDRLVLCNQQFVVLICRGFIGRGVAYEDLIQEGNLGLIRAATKFDHSKGFRFISYAVWWIRQSLQKATMCHNKPVELPQGIGNFLPKAYEANTRAWEATGRAATVDELFAALGSRTNAEAAIVAINHHNSLNELLKVEGHDSNDGAERIDILPSGQPLHDAEYADRDTASKISAVLDDARITSRGAEVLKMHFGLDGRPAMGLQQIANELNTSRENVRQHRNKSLLMLRRMRVSKALYAEVCHA